MQRESRLILATNVLLIDDKNGKLAAVVPALKHLGFQVMLVSSFTHATDLVTTHPGLSLVFIAEHMGAERAAPFVKAIRKSHPSLPVFWQSHKGATTPHPDMTTPLVLSEPIEPDEVAARIEDLVRKGLYPDEMLDELNRCAIAVMDGAFLTQLAEQGIYLRSNQSILAPINAVITFVGAGISGRLVVSSSLEHLSAIHQRILPGLETTGDHEADLLGEICNQILGKFKEYFERRSCSIFLGAPILIVGRDVDVRGASKHPSVVFRLHEDKGTLFVEYALDVVNPGAIGEEKASDLLDSGELTFL